MASHLLIFFQASSPQTGLPQSSGSLKSMKDKDKSNQQDKDGKEGSALQTAGPGGEITAGINVISIFLSQLFH